MLWFVLLAFLMVVLVFGRLLGSISRMSEVTEDHIQIQPLMGNGRRIQIPEIVDISVYTMGLLTHAMIRVRPTAFLSLAHTFFIIPVRGRFTDQQGLVKALWNKVPSSEHRML